MHKPIILAFAYCACLVVLVSSFLFWISDPNYSLFQIANYAGIYSEFSLEIKLLSVLAFLVPFGACLTLVCSFFERTSAIIGMITGIYTFLFTVGFIGLVYMASGEFSAITQTPGVYLALIASVVLILICIAGIINSGPSKKG